MHRCDGPIGIGGGIFGSEPFLLVFLKAIKLVPGNAPSILYWVADGVQVAAVHVLEAVFNTSHLLKSRVDRLT